MTAASAQRPTATGPLLIGHRGAKLYAPENTFPAFELALAHGCHGFEFDVRLSRDRQSVLIHDPVVKGVDVAMATAAEIGEITGDSIPRLGDVVKRFAPRALLNIELKVPGAEAEVSAMCRATEWPRGLLVSSFLPQVIETMHDLAPEIPLGYICDARNELAAWERLPITHFVLHDSLVTRDFAAQIQGRGLKLWVWTVNQRAAMESYAAMGVDGIISDDTKLLGDVLRGSHNAAGA